MERTSESLYRSSEKVPTDASPPPIVATLPEEVEGRFIDQDESPQVKQSESTINVSSLRIFTDGSSIAASILKGLGWLDRFLAIFVLLAMILGVIIGMHLVLEYLT